ncbi:MAG: outer membrane beta-barrel protein [Treponema sp.]|nr:outer membrane beta-barrel protein [Treponema sp.]
MKKLFTILLLSTLISGAFAKSWTNTFGAGFTVPFSKIGVDKEDEDDITQIGFGLEGFYLGYYDNGFTLKGDYAIALTTTRDIHIQDHKTNAGFFTNTSIGAGYTFNPTDNFIVSLTGMFGADVSIFKDSDEDVDYSDKNGEERKADYDRTLSLITVNVGMDLFTRCKLGENFGIFTNLSARYIIGGWGTDETSHTYDTRHNTRSDKTTHYTDLLGYFRIQPTFGVCWTF